MDLRNVKCFTNRVRFLEAALLTVSFLITYWWVATNSGGPLFLEELTYLEAAIQRIASPHIINRYFHIYLFLPFLEILGNPLLAVKFFWGFLVSATGLFVYISARLMSRAVLPGFVALMLFFSQVEIFRYPGAAWAEFSLMLLITISIAIYLFVPRSTKCLRLLFALLGFLFYLAIRTKETGLPFAVLILGLGWYQGDQYNLKLLIKEFKWVLAGIAAGVILMITLDYLFLGDALFAFRLQNVKEYLKFNLFSLVEAENYNLFFMHIDKLDMYNIFLLFFVSGFLLWDKQSKYEKTLYLVPLFTVVFLIFSLLRGPGIIQSRYLIPVLPLLCILASMPFKLERQEKPGRRTLALIIFLLTAVLIYYSLDFVIAFSEKYYIHKWYEGNYYFVFIHPIALCILLGILFFIRKFNSISIIVPLLCLVFISFPSLQDNFSHLNDKWAAGETHRHFYPFIVYSEDIQHTPEMVMGISDNLPGEDTSIPAFSMLDDNPSTVSKMFNVFFQENSTPEQFIRAGIGDLIGRIDTYTYVILTYEDWNRLSPDVIETIERTHTIKGGEEKFGVILLSHQ
jgi:hypothetical protein